MLDKMPPEVSHSSAWQYRRNIVTQRVLWQKGTIYLTVDIERVGLISIPKSYKWIQNQLIACGKIVDLKVIPSFAIISSTNMATIAFFRHSSWDWNDVGANKQFCKVLAKASLIICLSGLQNDIGSWLQKLLKNVGVVTACMLHSVGAELYNCPFSRDLHADSY